MRFALGACVGFVGCSFFVPERRTFVDRAREIEPKCRGSSEATVAPLVSRDVVDSVEPAYSYVIGGPNGREARLRGARIHVRPLPGTSRESIARELQCHEARVALGAAPARADDPYALPERWLTIDVESEGDGFVVLVRTDDVADAGSVLQRARHFNAHPAPASAAPESAPASGPPASGPPASGPPPSGPPASAPPSSPPSAPPSPASAGGHAAPLQN